MSRKLFVLLLTGFVGVTLLWAAPDKTVPKRKVPLTPLPVMGTTHDPEITTPAVPWRPSRHTLDDYIGTTDTAGTTWYDYQHNGTCGKLIGVDDWGIISVVWMNGLNQSQNPRYVYYNVWDSTLNDFMFPIGIRIDASERAGYITQVTNADGFCFPAFHQITTGEDPHAAAAGDWLPYSDAFTTIEPDWCYQEGTALAIIWPKIDMDINGVLHMISTASEDIVPARQRIFYSRGVPEYDADGSFLDIHWDQMDCGGFELMDTVTTISPDIACSRHSQRVVIAYTHPMFRPDEYPDAGGWHQRNNEVFMRISEDGGLNWDAPVNVTRWIPWDPECWYSTYDITCNRDTFRAYTDCAVLLDEADYIHIAFTTPGTWWYISEEQDTGLYQTFSASMIWHWSEATDCFSLVTDIGWEEADPPTDCGAWQYRAQRPNLAIDRTTRNLYCSFMKYDTDFSENGFQLSDAWVTVSTDNGHNWAVSTNVTNTMPEVIPTPPGECLNERDITLAKFVTDGYLHMEYVLDKDAGGVPQEEGVPTLNPVIYQRIPADQIPTSPLIEQYPMHWDSTGFPWSGITTYAHEVPGQFLLYQNYPNPFNPTTMLQFDLAKASRVTLKVFNVLGQEVASLLDDASLSAGAHRVEFDGANLASGVYVYSLISNGHAASKKMVLMK